MNISMNWDPVGLAEANSYLIREPHFVCNNSCESRVSTVVYDLVR